MSLCPCVSASLCLSVSLSLCISVSSCLDCKYTQNGGTIASITHLWRIPSNSIHELDEMSRSTPQIVIHTIRYAAISRSQNTKIKPDTRFPQKERNKKQHKSAARPWVTQLVTPDQHLRRWPENDDWIVWWYIKILHQDQTTPPCTWMLPHCESCEFATRPVPGPRHTYPFTMYFIEFYSRTRQTIWLYSKDRIHTPFDMRQSRDSEMLKENLAPEQKE